MNRSTAARFDEALTYGDDSKFSSYIRTNAKPPLQNSVILCNTISC
jgi:hypothetical protein